MIVGFILIEAVVALLLHKKVPPGILGVAVNVAAFPSQMVWLFLNIYTQSKRITKFFLDSISLTKTSFVNIIIWSLTIYA